MKSASPMPLICLLIAMLIAPAVYADEADFCRRSCDDDLKECRTQADATADSEAHPFIFGRSSSHVYENGELAPLVANSRLLNSRDSGVEQRKMDRYQQCAAENDQCRRLCSQDSVPNSVVPNNGVVPKSSVILK